MPKATLASFCLGTEDHSPTRTRQQDTSRENATSLATALRHRRLSSVAAPPPRMLTMPIKLHHSFGTPTTFGAALVQEDVILHPVGRHIVLHDLVGHKMNVLHDFPAEVERITAISLTQSLKFIAMCEVVEGSQRPQVRVLKLTRVRSVTVGILSAEVEGPFLACCFSDDGQYLLAYTGEPDHMVVVWHWVEERPSGLMRVKAPIGRARFNPGEWALS